MERNLIHVRAQMGALEEVAPLRLYRLCKEVNAFFANEDKLATLVRPVILLHSFAQLGVGCHLAQGIYNDEMHYWVMVGSRLYDPIRLHTGYLRKPYTLHKLSEAKAKDYLAQWQQDYPLIRWQQAMCLFQQAQNTHPIVQNPLAVSRFQQRNSTL